MNLLLRNRDRALLSLSSAELSLVEDALSQMSSVDSRQCLASLREQLQTRPRSTDFEITEAWSDGGSVQVRAITVYADPIDMGTGEARAYAHKILTAADEADSV
jgi:hypothetical protein